jgi:signal transduction histidine kinase/CheY-like chemotaxis protein
VPTPDSIEIELDARDVSELFPFAFLLDREMRIVAAGPSLARILSAPQGQRLSDVFELRRPAKLLFDEIAGGYRPLCIFAARGGELIMRGQLRYHSKSDGLLFVGSPWVTELGTLGTLGLKFSDFAPHEPVVDMLQLMQAQLATTDEVRRIGERLGEQRRELERTLRWLTLQYAVSDALLTNAEADVPSRVLSLLCQSTEWQAAALWLTDGERLRAEASWTIAELHPPEAATPSTADALLDEVWHTGIARTVAGARFVCPVFDAQGGTLGVVEMSLPTNTPGSGSSMAVSEVAIKLGLYYERLRAHTALRSAKEQAEAGTRAKSQFLANISHELRTPLNGMLGTAQLLADNTLPPTAASYVQTLLSSGNNLLAIINDLLDLAKIEAGKLGLELSDCEPVQVVEEAVEHFCSSAQAKRISLLVEAHTLRSVRCDPLRLRQVLWNLIGNAIKFTSRGYVRIAVRERKGASPGIAFEIADSGIGIPEARAKDLFTPFEQADPSVTRTYGGTGLGLAICKRLITSMGGEIGLRSEVGKGSTFWFVLPTAPAIHSAQPALPASNRPLAVCVLGDKQVRDVLAANLEWLGYHAAAFGDIQQARALGDPASFLVCDAALAHDPALRAWLDPNLLRVLWYAGTSPESSDRELSTLRDPVTPSRLREALEGQAAVLNVPAKARVDTPIPAGRRVRILLVEDNPVNQLVASAMLRQLGYSVDIAASGRECIERLHAHLYELVLMDCQMPELDGFDTTRLIRSLEDETRRRVPVIALTAGARSEDRELCISAGMNDFLPKPLNRAELAAALDRWVSTDSRSVGRTLPG